MRWWQDRLTPVWKRPSGGCHLNGAVDGRIENAGFRIEQLTNGYMRGPKPMTFMYEGALNPDKGITAQAVRTSRLRRL